MKILNSLFCAILAGLAPMAIGQSATPAPVAKAAASSPPSVERLVEQSGRVTDTRNGLVWAQSDNRLDTTWPQAVGYCKRKGDRWRLPAVSELKSLHDVTQSVACGAWKCQVSPKFQLSGPWFWSNERKGVSDAAFVNLTSGASNGTHVGNRNGLQALCVRPA